VCWPGTGGLECEALRTLVLVWTGYLHSHWLFFLMGGRPRVSSSRLQNWALRIVKF
jgi:hypothetical protein